MRSMLSATLMIVTMATAQAQMTPPSTAGAKPKTVATVPVRPALQKPEETASGMTQAERLALQSDLAWVGQYNGAITGDVSERMVNAIKEFQKSRGGKPTGVLNPQERGALAETARRKRESVGWRIVTEPGTGARLGIPSKLVPQLASGVDGAKWTSPTGTVQVVLARRKEANPTTAKLAEREKNEPGRTVDYTVVKPDFFVLSGLQGLKKFYIRGTFKGDDVRVLTVLYDQATENTVEPVVIAMSSAFSAFPSGPQVAGPPPRKTVEYGTGVFVSDDGAIVTDRLVTDECIAITIPGHGNADRIAEDKEHDLALLHIYGARGLKPLNIGATGAKTALDLTGIADPQNQSGANAVSSAKATATPVGSDVTLTPAPALGFSGAAALDADGKFAGLALLKPVVVAGPANAIPTSQAMLAPAETVSAFLKAHGVIANGTSSDANAAVVRVICVRK
ncbi:serine protease [Bradyrhizobium cenepequi]|uniref:serine protease n=1 Tax=Bradyrhizobium cenepequi TaxID=2821403 RepID=UPI001CE35562|nr:serine protease [Bradyrhizobium cenepequi]MCA6107604.1 peptidoglycan-binding protein [Bradyrhizobium cenepequi]